jgi:uncharacterized membrane protein YciS (DUF1049 family)
METLIGLVIFGIIFVIYKISQVRNNKKIKERMLKRIKEMEAAGYTEEAATLRKAFHWEND